MANFIAQRLLIIFIAIQFSFFSALALAQDTPNYQILGGKLDNVLTEFALQSGIEFHVDAGLSEDLYSTGLSGSYQPEQALHIILNNTGLVAELQPDGSYRLLAQSNAMALQAVQVRTSFNDAYQRDKEGKMAIYDDDSASAYLGKEEVERFKGNSAADLFTGIANASSSEARNGGGSMNPNIRGVQGFGRVPVEIDGTEQAITVYNGYRGASTRNYIDPNMVASMKVYQGAQINTDMNTSVGGGVQLTTLQPQDIVPKGDTFGFEMIGESSSNAVEPNDPNMHTGESWYDIPAYVDTSGVPIYADPEIFFEPRDDKNDNPFNGEDQAMRVAVAQITPKLEWILAYSYRDRGNYYSGTNESGFYSQPYDTEEEASTAGRNTYVDPEHIALSHYPGEEVPNTSSRLESFLGKTTLNLSDYAKLQFSARYTASDHGEILASRSDYRTSDGLAQWPLGKVRQQAYSIELRENTKHPWLDYTATIWSTLSDTSTNTGYGSPNQSTDDSDIIFNGSTINRDERRYGVTLKDNLKLSDDLDVTLASSYQYHKLLPQEGLESMIDYYEGGPVRAGERQEFNGVANMQWRLYDTFIFDAGLRYTWYETQDYYIENRIETGNTEDLKQTAVTGYTLTYETVSDYSDEEIAQNIANAEIDVRLSFDKDEISDEITRITNIIDLQPELADSYTEEMAALQEEYDNFDSLLEEKIEEAVTTASETTTYTEEQSAEWLADGDGYSLSDNACVIAQEEGNYVEGSCDVTLNATRDVYNTDYKISDSGWMPSLTASWLISERDRFYLRAAQTIRFPSLYESTSGFSSSYSGFDPLENEVATIYEAAYVHYFDHASFKLTYFEQSIKNVIDRYNSIMFTNLDSQETAGVEVNANYDNQHFFADASFAYNFRNEVCDESTASTLFIDALEDGDDPSYDECVRGGFSTSSYLAASAAPEYTANLLLGSRLLDRKLELGFRSNYVSSSHEDEIIARTSVTTHDAYAKYRFNKYMSGELSGKNLTDIYYLDTGSVSGMPAPGRTITFKLSGHY